jgi:hypothetical protein
VSSLARRKWSRKIFAVFLRRMLTDVANELRDRAALEEEECFIDATFVMAKGGGADVGGTKRAGRHENLGDCAPRQPNQAAHPRSATTKPLHAALAKSSACRLDRVILVLEVPSTELPRLCPPHPPRRPLPTI